MHFDYCHSCCYSIVCLLEITGSKRMTYKLKLHRSADQLVQEYLNFMSKDSLFTNLTMNCPPDILFRISLATYF